MDIKLALKRTGKVLSITLISLIGLIIIALCSLCVPSVQTMAGKQATRILAEKMQTNISIDRLRIDFNLKIVVQGLQICDQKDNNLISAAYVRMDFPIFKPRYLEFNNVYADSADVYMRTYEGEDELNMRFFINFFKNDKPKPQKMVINFQHLTMRNSRYHLRNDNKAGEDEPGLWNYSNMILTDINTKMEQMIIVGDSLNFYIDELSCKERSGFELTEYKGRLELWKHGIYSHGTHFATANGSDVNIDFGFDFESFKSFKNFDEDIAFNTYLHASHFNTADLSYFVRALQGMPNMVDLYGQLTGPLADIKLSDARLAISPFTYFIGDIHCKGLPHIKQTHIDVNCHQLNADMKDVAAFHLPQGKSINLPTQLLQLKQLSVLGVFDGMYNNFYTNLEGKSNMGDFTCKANCDYTDKKLTYDGEVNVQSLQLGTLLKTDMLGDISANVSMEGHGVKIADMNTRIKGNIQAINFKGTYVHNISLLGDVGDRQFNGHIECPDSNFNIEFDGLVDFDEETPIYNFTADLHNINLSELKLFRTDSNAGVAAHVEVNMAGRTLDSLYGDLTLSDIAYTENDVIYYVPDLTVTAEQYVDNKQDIMISSDILEAKLYGDFQYRNIINACKHALHTYLPALIPLPQVEEDTPMQTLYASAHMEQSLPIIELFLPQITFAEGLSLNAYLSEQDNEILLDANIPVLQLKKQCLRDIDVKSSSDRKDMKLDVSCSGFQFKVNDTLNDINNIKLKSTINTDTITFTANALGNEANKLEDVYMEGMAGFWNSKHLFVALTNGSVLWNEESFLLDTLNRVVFSPNLIHVDNFGIRSLNDRSLQVYSKANAQNEEAIFFDFNNIELGMLNIFLNRFNITLQGSATGKGGILNTGNKKQFAVGSGIEVKDFYFNDAPLGFLDARTIWQSQVSKLFINADLYLDSTKENRLTNINGHFDPLNKYIDLDGDIRNFNLKSLEPYLKSFAYKMEGYGTGTLSFKGPIKDPKLLGEVTVYSGVMGIDYLKTEYTIHNRTISFVDTGFIFNNVTVSDMYNNKIAVNGMITHHKLKNWGMNLRMRASNALALNTTLKDNNLFYGKAFVTGNISMKGQAGDIIQINADVTTEPKTDISLLFDWSTSANESKVITFVNPYSEKKDTKANTSGTNMGVNMKIKATPEAIVRVNLDPSIGGTIIGRGAGTVELNVSPETGFNIYGVYTLSDGVFNIAYGDILTRSFKLQNGGTISWTGDPKGTMDVKAVQSAKVSINNLVAGSEEHGSYRPVAVNNILSLKGNLLKPDFNFSFDMPDADESIKTIVYNSIDTSDREEMVKQMVAVLFLGMFESNDAATASGTINSGIGYSISELVSYQINKFVSSISDNFDVRVAYRSNEDNAENEYSVDVGGSFLNDRLTIKTSLGVLDQKDLDNSDRFLGDITAEYKITKDGALKVKAFNVTNQQDKLEYTSKYSQGIGFSFSKDFNTFKDLFSRKKKKQAQAYATPADTTGR